MQTSTTFKNKIARSNKAGLVDMLRERNIRQETLRVRFARTRTVENGEAYRKVSLEISELKSALATYMEMA